MRVAAIDYGSVRVGLAVSDELGLLAHPRPFLDGRNDRDVLKALSRLAEEDGIMLFLVGLPRTLAGREGTMAKKARRFAEQLSEETGRPVEMWDERFTTREAEQRLRASGMKAKSARQRVDSAAAALLLQSYLDRRRD